VWLIYVSAEFIMDIIEAMNMMRRFENLPEINLASDRAVIKTLNSYFSELHETEKDDEAYFQADSRSEEYKQNSIAKKIEIHKRYWSNHSTFYEPCSLSSMARYDWEKITDVLIQRNDDDDDQLFLFIAKYNMTDTTKMDRTYLLKKFDGKLLIEHAFG